MSDTTTLLTDLHDRYLVLYFAQFFHMNERGDATILSNKVSFNDRSLQFSPKLDIFLERNRQHKQISK